MPAYSDAIVTLTGADRSPALTTTPLLPGALKSVTYPSGGKTEVAYGLHRYYEGGGGTQTTTVPKSASAYNYSGDSPTRTTWLDLTPATFTTGTIATGAGVPAPAITGGQDIRVGSTQCAPNGPCAFVTLREGGATGTIVHERNSSSALAGTLPIALKSNTTYTLQVRLGWRASSTECPTNNCHAPFSVGVSWTENGTVSTPPGERVGGGLRVETITQSSGLTGGTNRVRTFSYVGTDGNSSGRMVNRPEFVFPYGGGTQCAFAVQTSSPRPVLGTSGLASVWYGTVKESVSGAGATTHSFTIPYARIPNTYGTTGLYMNVPFETSPRDDWANGLRTSAKARNSSNADVREDATTYRRYDLMNSSDPLFQPAKYRRILGLQRQVYSVGETTYYFGWYEIVSAPVVPAQEVTRVWQ